MNTFPAGLPHRSRARRNSIVALALASTALVALAAQPSIAAGALPAGGAFAAGAGTISATSSGLAINQTSARGIITWQSFSIAAGQLVQFNNGAGATLNRVTGTDISTIAGMIRATGSVYLVNPYGVMIAPGGQVITTGSFVASTRDIANTAFMQGGTLEFQGTSAGNVVNQGTITSSNGDVFLIGQSVENDGQISAANGTAGLAAGDDVLIQPLNGDQRIFIATGSGNVTNTGTVSAAQAELNAAGGNVYALAGNTGGLVSATGTTTVNGHVWLTAGQTIDVTGTVSAKNADGSGGEVDMTAGSSSGTLTVSGTVDTSSASGNGGVVTMTAADVSLAGTAVVTASGAADGGVILIGGDRSGGSDPSLDLSPTPIADAQQTSVAPGAEITADAGSGDGGSVVVWSQQETDFAGAISAQGAGGGNGGFAEVSSHELLGFTGTVDLLAAGGTTGTLLLDPANVTISTSATSSDALSSGTYSPSSGVSSSTILNTDLETALASSSVVIATANSGSAGSGAGSITVSAPISWSSANALTLQASPGAGITIAAAADTIANSAGANITLIGDTLTLPSTSSAVVSTAGTVTIAPATASTNINLGSGTGLTIATSGTGSMSDISAGTLVMGAATDTGTVTLNATLNASGGLAHITNLQLVSGSGNISIAGTLALASVGVLTLDTSGTVSQSSAFTTSGLSLQGGGNFNLTSTSNSIATLAGSVGTVTLDDAVALTVGATGGASGLTSTGSGGISLAETLSAGITTTATTGTVNSDGAGPVMLKANAVTLGGTVTASGQTVTVLPESASTTMSIDGSSTLNLSTAALDDITAQTLVFGSTITTGAMTVGGSVTLPSGITNLMMISGSGTALTFSANAVLADANSGGGITLEANKLTLTNSGSGVAATGSGGTVTILPATATTTIGIGTGAGTLALTAAALANITAPTLIIGSTGATGAMTVGGTVTLPSTVTNLDLVSGASTLTFNASAVLTDGNSGGNITLEANGVTLTNTASAVKSTGTGGTVTILPATATTTMSLAGSSTLNLTQAALNNITASTLIFGSLSGNGTANAAATGDLTVGGAITVPSTIGTLELETACVATCGGSAGIITISNGGSIKTSTGGSVILADGNEFVNDDGSGALVASGTNARWLVYSQTPANDTKDGLVYAFKQYGTALLGALNGAITAGQSGFIYTTAPAATVSLTGTVSGTYSGTNAATLSAANYSVIANGDPNNADTVVVNDPTSGTYAQTNTGTGITVSVSGLSIVSATDSTGAAVYGYTLASSSASAAVGTINAATLTVTPDAVSTTYNGTALSNTSYSDSTGNYSITGFVAGQTVSSAGVTLTGSMAFNGSTATVVENAGTYSQSAGTLTLSAANNNYTLSFSNPTPNNYVITQAGIAVTLSGTETYNGTTTAAASILTITDLTLGDMVTLTGSVTLASANVGSESITSLANLTLGGSAGSNYTTSGGSGTVTVNAAGLTITAGSESKTYGQTFSSTGSPSEFTASGLVGSDSVSAVTLASLGAAATAGVAGSPYTLTPSAAVGSGLGNYSITYDTGSLTVNQALLTVTANSTSKTYGQTVSFAGTEFTTSGLVNSDSVGSVTLTSAGAAATANVTGSPYSITPSAAVGSGLGNYSITYDAGSLAVNQAALTITAGSESKTYGQTFSSTGTPSEFTTSGLVNSDSVGSVTLASLGSVATAGVAGSPYTLTPSAAAGSGLGNYSITYDVGSLAVNQAALTITAGSESKTYGQTFSSTGTPSEFTTSGLVNSDSVGSVTLASLGSAATAGVTGSPYTLTPSAAVGSGLGNYSITYDAGSLAVNQALLTVTANSTSKTYGQTVSFAGTEFTTTGLVNSDSVGSVTLTSAGAAATAGVTGSPYAITPSAAVGSGLGNYSITYDAGSLTVNQAALTITANSTSKTYGQTVGFAGTEFTTSGLVNSDSVGSVTLTSAGAAATAGVTGSPYAITPSAAVGSGLGNYSITYDTGSLAVNPLAVVLGGTAVYNATTSVLASSLSVSNLIGSDTVTVGGTTATLAGKDVGAETITSFLNLSLSGSSSADYTLTGASGSVTVTPKALTVSGLSAANKVYDGTDAATLSGAGSLAGGEAPGTGTSIDGTPYTGDSVTLTGSASGTFTQATVGTGITVNLSSTLGLTGGQAGDYTLVAPASLTANITPAALTITAGSESKTYGQTFSSTGTPSEFTTSGLVSSDSVSAVTLASLGLAATAGVTGSPYTLTPSAAVGSGLGNYTITYDTGSLAVNQAALTITAGSESKTYGQTFSSTGAPSEFTTSGLVNSDSVSGVTLASLGLAATAGVAGSPYTLTPSAAVGTGLGNYSITYDTGSLTVNQAALTITANSTSKTYGQTVSFAGTEFTTSGLVNSDSVGSVTLTSAGAAATAGVTGSPYAITPSAAVGSGLGNYSITYDAGSLTVNPLAIVLGGTAVYNATTSVLASSLSVSNLIGSDSVTLSGSATLAGANVGAEAITGNALSLGGSSAADYTVTGASGSVTVTPKSLTVSGLSVANKVYDGTDAATLSGAGSLASGEAPGTGTSADGTPYTGDSVTLTGSASGTFTQANVGTGITVNLSSTLGLTGGQAGDYTLVAPASLTANITPAALTITAGSESKTYGQTFSSTGTPSEFTASGLVSSDNVSGVTLASAGLAATAGVAGSPYTLTPSAAVGSGLGNYSITYDAGSLAVNQAALTITAGSESKTYGQTFSSTGTPSEFTTSGLVNSDSVGSVTLASLGLVATAGVAGSPYTLTPSAAVGSGLGNYAITYDVGSLAVNQAALTITADSTSKTYGQTVSFAGTEFTTSGLVNSDSVGSVTLTSAGAAATAGVTGSPYTITPSAAAGSGLGNYSITYDAGSLTVNQALLTITAGSESKTYGQTFSSTGTPSEFTTSGLVNSDSVGSVTLASLGLAATAGVAGSPYTLTPSAAVGSGLGNYSITYDAGSLAVNQAALTIAANNESFVVGGASLPPLTLSFSGFVAGDTASVLSPTPAATTTALLTSPIGGYPISVSSTSDPNYRITYVPGTLSIVTVSAPPPPPPPPSPTPSTPSAASIVVSTVPPITTVTIVTPPPVIASLGNFSLDILAQQFNAIVPAAGGNTPVPGPTPQHPGLNVVCAASGDATLTITCTQ